MKTQILKMVSGAILGLLIMGNISAQPGDGRLIDSIPGITKDQKVKIAGIHESYRIEMGELREKRNAATTWEAKDALDKQLLDKRIEHRNAIRNVLTNEQKKYFDANFEKAMAERRGHGDKKDFKGRHGRHGDGPMHEKHDSILEHIIH